MREELMVKGDTINKTSSGKLSAAGGIKGQGEGLSHCQGSGPLLGMQVPSMGGGRDGACGALWPENHPATSGTVQAVPELRVPAPFRTPGKDLLWL